MGSSIVPSVLILARACAPAATRALVLAVAVLLGASCAQVPEPPVLAETGAPDPTLVVGRDVWAKHCVRCHGATGDGGRGPSLSNGAVAEKYPSANVQVSIITQGLNGKMPGFRSLLTADEIDAVVSYTREVL